MLKTKDGKLVTCRQCKNKTTEYLIAPGTISKFCSYDCITNYALNKARKDSERKQRQSDKVRLAELNNTIKHWRPKAQKSFNAFIRERDKDLPCVSCGSTKKDNHLTGGAWDCGHYRSTGANPELRFCEVNAHKQCVKCNRDLSGNIVNYRIELVKRIGIEKLEWLEGPHPPAHYKAEDYKRIEKEYKQKLKELKNDRK